MDLLKILLCYLRALHGNWHTSVPVSGCLIPALLIGEESKYTWSLSSSSYSLWHSLPSPKLWSWKKFKDLFMFQCSQTCLNLYTITWKRDLFYTLKSAIEFIHDQNWLNRASLVARWLRVCLPMQGTRVRALVWEDPTCHGATRPVSHNHWACASGACAPQQERPR